MPDLFNTHDMNRHMPYIFEGNKLLFSQASTQDDFYEDYGSRSRMGLTSKSPFRAYRVCVGDLDLNAGTVTNIKEIDCCEHKNIYCSPCAYRDEDGKINFTFIKEWTLGNSMSNCRAYKRIGEDFDSLGDMKHIKPVMGVRSYCITENKYYRVVASSRIGNVYLMVFKKSDKTISKIQIGNCPFIRRVSLESGTNNLLVTYPESKNGAYNSAATHYTERMNLETLETFKIVAEDKSIYKSTIYGDKVIYSKRGPSQESYSMDLKISEYSLTSGKIRPNIQYVREVPNYG